VLHGGYYRARYDLGYIGHLAAALAAEGIATWSVEYRRLGQPGGGWPSTFLDVGAGLDALRQLAANHALDLTRVITLGHSAGGHLALWAAGRDRLATSAELGATEPLPVGGVVALAPVADLERASELGLSNGVVDQLMGGPPAAVPERYKLASPLRRLPLGIPQVVLHGTADAHVPFELSERYVAAARAAGDLAALVALPGIDHFDPIDPRTPSFGATRSAARRLLGDALQPPA
jgi:acetyl esterase/lipase